MDYLLWNTAALIVPLSIMWALYPRVLSKYIFLMLQITMLSALFGIAWDAVAVWLDIWPYGAGTLGIRLLHLPLDDYMFILLAPLVVSSAALCLRKYLDIR